MSSQYNSKRILNNTLLLYLRMIIVTVVSFFTVRITLRILGVEDYGIYNVVGGLISFLAILSATMSSATQRYLAFDLGKNDTTCYNRTFSLLILVYISLSVLIIILGEALGPWLISSYLVIPTERVIAAQWVYQFSLMSFGIELISTPYKASIISYEKMGIFAFVGLIDAFGKLIVTALLYFISYDKLVIYAFLMLFISLANFFIQYIYCKLKLKGCTFHFYFDKNYLKEIIGYTGWNLFGAASGTLNTAGVSLVLNLFFGPLVNAAKGIADRINGIVVSFAVNFFQAISPQIVKTFAAGDIEHSRMLVYRSSKLSFFLMFVLSLPLICEMASILNIWLGKDAVTTDMIVFSRLVLVYSLVNIFEQPITMIIRATGKIKKYQVCVGFVTLAAIPLCVLLFSIGFPAYWSLISLTVVYLIALLVRLLIAQKQIGLSITVYLKTVLYPISLVILVSVGVVSAVKSFFNIPVFVLFIFEAIISFVAILFIGLKEEEKQFLLKKFFVRI